MSLTKVQLRRLCLKGVVSSADYLMYIRVFHSTKKKQDSRRFNLDTLTDDDCLNFMRFSREEIIRLFKALKIPSRCFIRKTRDKFAGIEGLCILLRRLSYPNRFCEMQKMFFRSVPALSRICKWVLNFVYKRVGHLMSNLNHSWLNEDGLREFSEAVATAGSPYPNIVGFIDGTARPICRPIRGQEFQYSGYKKSHVLKYQSVVFPNGLIGRLDGPINGRRHDAAILQISGLLHELRRKFICHDGSWYALYGDAGYSNQKFIKVGFKNHNKLTDAQKAFNAQMSSLRVNVEYGFGKILQYFAFLDFKKNQKLLLQPLKEMYVVAAVLTNCLTCFRGGQISDHFGCSPPVMETYLEIHV